MIDYNTKCYGNHLRLTEQNRDGQIYLTNCYNLFLTAGVQVVLLELGDSDQ